MAKKKTNSVQTRSHRFDVNQYINFKLKGRSIQVHAVIKNCVLGADGQPMYYVYNAGSDTFKYSLISEDQIVSAFIKHDVESAA